MSAPWRTLVDLSMHDLEIIDEAERRDDLGGRLVIVKLQIHHEFI